MPYEIMIRSIADEQLYMRRVAVHLAGVTAEFWISCEEEGLVVAQKMTGGGKGFRMKDIQQMALVWRLHRDLDLDLPAIEIILNMRRKIIDLQSEISALKYQARSRERRLLEEIKELQRRSSMTV